MKRMSALINIRDAISDTDRMSMLKKYTDVPTMKEAWCKADIDAIWMGPGYGIRCGVVLVTRKKPHKVLVVKQRSAPHNWGVPKGSMDTTDAGAFECAMRELKEETGIDSTKLVDAEVMPMPLLMRRTDAIKEVLIFFVITVPDVISVVLETSELSDYKWIPKSDMRKMSPVAIPIRELSNIMRELKIEAGWKLTKEDLEDDDEEDDLTWVSRQISCSILSLDDCSDGAR